MSINPWENNVMMGTSIMMMVVQTRESLSRGGNVLKTLMARVFVQLSVETTLLLEKNNVTTAIKSMEINVVANVLLKSL